MAEAEVAAAAAAHRRPGGRGEAGGGRRGRRRQQLPPGRGRPSPRGWPARTAPRPGSPPPTRPPGRSPRAAPRPTWPSSRSPAPRPNSNRPRLNLSYTKIYAPVDGHVTRKNVEPGAYVQVGQPLLALVEPDVWVVANFKETQLTNMPRRAAGERRGRRAIRG